MNSIKFIDNYSFSYYELDNHVLGEDDVLKCSFPDGHEINVKIKMEDDSWVMADMSSGVSRGSFKSPYFEIKVHGLVLKIDKLHLKPLLFGKVDVIDREPPKRKEYKTSRFPGEITPST